MMFTLPYTVFLLVNNVSIVALLESVKRVNVMVITFMEARVSMNDCVCLSKNYEKKSQNERSKNNLLEYYYDGYTTILIIH